MPQLIIPDVDESLLRTLQNQASAHGTSPETEARRILQQALEPPKPATWDAINASRQRLAASGRTFSDSAELIREDRAR